MANQEIEKMKSNQEQIINLLNKVEKPGRYIGGELNSVVKDHSSVKTRFAFCFPDLYEIGMSYMGMQILYNIINKEQDLLCERVFAPGEDMAKQLKASNLSLFTLETKTPLHKMDVVGFTLQYEMSFTNILYILDLGGIPLLKSQRSDEHPLILAGGPCAYNPEPLADFVDVFLIGDGENNLPKLLKDYGRAKEQGISKAEFLKSVCKDEGVYVPELYDVTYNEDGTVKEYKTNYQDAPLPVTRAMVHDLEDALFPTENIVPFMETVHDRAVVETFRGCTRGCRFCQAGMIYRPIRERSTSTIVDIATKQLNATGHDELSLLSLSTSDHSDFENLALALLDQCQRQDVSLSLPSLRLDSFSFNVLNEIQKYKKSGLTFAPEAGSQRLRDVINKGITKEDILSATSQAIQLGWRNIKLYFMVGLPTETFEDLDGMADIASSIVELHRQSGKGGRFNVTVSVSNFVPKAHTPFQWWPQDSQETFKEKHLYLKDKLKGRNITFNYHEEDVSFLEAVIARGDRKIGRLIYEAYKQGCKMDGWSEFFSFEKWMKAMELADIDPHFYANRTRNLDETLPWDIINSAVTKNFLKREWEKAQAEQTTDDCRIKCTGCGINKITKCKWGGVGER